jgi:retron-type reverse transcriptase
MKIAKVIPIYKASDPSLLKNYRPISLLPAFSKLLEKIMYDKLMSFLVSKNILYKHQYGFRSKHSTIHPILHFLNHCADANNKPQSEFTLAVLCDLSKAFDVIDHKILLHKLEAYGIRGIPNKWIENYLSNRQQYVQFENSKSSCQPINCGVPQGSILGPLLYLIYVNDIKNSCTSNILSFADDTTILHLTLILSRCLKE